MQLIVWLASAIIALAFTALLTRARRLGVARRREQPNRLLRDVAVLFVVALFFPLWDYVLVDTLGVPLIHLWTPRPDFTIGAAVLLILPIILEIMRGGRSPGLGWRLPSNALTVIIVLVVSLLLGALPILMRVPVTATNLYDTLLSLLTIVILEEMLFRGAIQGRLEMIFAGHWPWLLSGVLYGLWFVPALFAGAGQTAGPAWLGPLGWWLAQASLGWLLSITRDRTGSLLPGLVAHLLLLQTAPLLALALGL